MPSNLAAIAAKGKLHEQTAECSTTTGTSASHSRRRYRRVRGPRLCAAEWGVAQEPRQAGSHALSQQVWRFRCGKGLPWSARAGACDRQGRR